jgi:hypothetical protein
MNLIDYSLPFPRSALRFYSGRATATNLVIWQQVFCSHVSTTLGLGDILGLTSVFVRVISSSILLSILHDTRANRRRRAQIILFYE